MGKFHTSLITPASMTDALEHRTNAKISARLLPLLIACYFAAFSTA